MHKKATTSRQHLRSPRECGKTQRTEPSQRVLFHILSYLAFIIVLVVLFYGFAFSLVLFSIELKNSYNPYNSPYARAGQAINQTYGQNVAQH